jgi:hypothetical protein
METESDAPPTAVMSVIQTCAKQRNVWVFRNLEEDEVVSDTLLLPVANTSVSYDLTRVCKIE